MNKKVAKLSVFWSILLVKSRWHTDYFVCNVFFSPFRFFTQVSIALYTGISTSYTLWLDYVQSFQVSSGSAWRSVWKSLRLWWRIRYWFYIYQRVWVGVYSIHKVTNPHLNNTNNKTKQYKKCDIHTHTYPDKNIMYNFKQYSALCDPSVYMWLIIIFQIDLVVEAENLDRFNKNFSKVSCVKFPRPVWPFVTHDILVETYEVLHNYLIVI